MCSPKHYTRKMSSKRHAHVLPSDAAESYVVNTVRPYQYNSFTDSKKKINVAKIEELKGIRPLDHLECAHDQDER